MDDPAHPKPKKQISKRRVELEKRVVKVKIGANADPKLKSQIPPSDSWSWRKYGQKPIKGTPYPRGYYKCTTSKGCLAKKHVERSKDDASMVIITYTSGHNHPGPGNQPIKTQPKAGDDESIAQKGDHVEEEENKSYVVTLENKCFQDKAEEEESVSWSEMMMNLSSTEPKSGGENEFFDELGELPTISSSSFTSFMKNYFFDERMLVPHP